MQAISQEPLREMSVAEMKYDISHSESQSLYENGMTSPLDTVLHALETHHCHLEEQAGKWVACCPAHDDEHPTLHIDTGDDGRLLLHCFAGCETKAIVAALGIEMSDLFSKNGAGKAKDGRLVDWHHRVGCYVYQNADRSIAYRVERFPVYDRQGGVIIDKAMPQSRPDGNGGWIKGRGKTEAILYKLPEIIEAPADIPVHIVEGEGKADRLMSLGKLATCNTGGQGKGKWKDSYSEVLRGQACLLFPDNDQVGREHMQRIARSLAGKAASVKVVELPGLPPKGDVIDFLDAGGTITQLDELAEKTPEWPGCGLDPLGIDVPSCGNRVYGKEQSVGPTDDGVGFGGFGCEYPQVSPIFIALRPVPKLDELMLPGSFRSWVKDIAERACCPLDLPSISALVSIASVVGRKVAIRPKRHDDWTVVPNLWGMGVLPPGWLKTHCLEEPKKPLARLELNARKQHASAMSDFEITKAVATARTEAAKAELKNQAKKKKTEAELKELAAQTLAKSELEPPTLLRCIVNDATVEKLGELLAENPNGLLLYRDELMGFLKGLEKQGREGDRAFYLESWNGTGSYSYDRIGRGSLFIPSNTISILGGIQPGKLASYIREVGSGENDDGLVSRFQLAVYPDVDQPFVNVDRWPDTGAKNLAYAVFEKLAVLDPRSRGAVVDADGEIPYLRFSDDAQRFFDSWRVDLESKVRSSREAANLTSHLSKYRSLMPSLALLFHLIDGMPGPVPLVNAAQAVLWCQYLEEHARRIYQAAFDGDPEPAQRLGERLKNSLPSPFKSRDVWKKGWKGLATKEEADRALSILEDHGWVVRQEKPVGYAGGRPTEEFYINPAITKIDPVNFTDT